jgi:hypothetical protein
MQQPASVNDERRRQRAERTRGGGGATTGVTQQPAGKQEANGRGGICRQEAVDCWEDEKQQQREERCRDNQPEAPADQRGRRLESLRHLETMIGGGWAARGGENEAARCNDNRGRWMRRDKRQRDNQPGQTREVNGKRTPRLAVGRQERQRRTVTILLPSKWWNVCLTRFALLDFML